MLAPLTRRIAALAVLVGALVAVVPAAPAGAAPAGDARGVSQVYETPNPPAGPGEPVVALTFDDGPHPAYTPQILDILARYGAKATFFELGGQAERHPELVQRIIAEGHVIANHTWGHPHLPRVTPERFAFEIDHTTEVLQSISGQRIACVRPPYGDADPNVTQQIAARGLASVVWTADSRDFEKPGVDAIVASALKGLHAGSVILMHDGGGDRSQTIAALPRIIEGIQAAGLRIAPICAPGPPNAVPIGYLDSVVPSRGHITLAGWAMDPDAADSIEVHTYIDGVNAGGGVANGARPDLASFGLGEAHGFSTEYPAKPGAHEVCVFGINIGISNANPQLGCQTVEVPPLTALDDLRDLIADLRWTQLVEQVHLTEAVARVHATRRAAWHLIGPVAPDALPATSG